MNKILYSLLFVALFIYSCGTTESNKSSENKENKEEDKRKTELLQCNSLLEKIEKLTLSLEIESLLVKQWVNEQSRSDSKGKQELITLQKTIPVLIADIEKSSLKQFDSDVQELSKDYNKFDSKIEEIKDLLNSFESYENPTNLFMARALVEEDGEVEQTYNKIKFNCENLRLQIAQKKEHITMELSRHK